MNKTTATSSPQTETSDRSCFNCRENPAIAGDGPGSGLCRFCALAYEALDAFWEVIVRHFPEAKSGDLSPERTIGLHSAASIAIREWISNNAEPQDT
jgi:hypothetical protein